MKKLLLFVSVFFFVGFAMAQDRAVGLQGLVYSDGVQVYEWAGYSITVEKEIKTPESRMDFAEIKKLYKVDKPHKIETVGQTIVLTIEDTLKAN